MTTLLWLFPGLVAGFGILAIAVYALVEGSFKLADWALARLSRHPVSGQKEAA